MLYILDQRLQAQSIPIEKSKRGSRMTFAPMKTLPRVALPDGHDRFRVPMSPPRTVLQDVIATMFSVKFVEEMFKPQELYTNASTRQIFDRIAHSSIMRLNESSMDKVQYYRVAYCCDLVYFESEYVFILLRCFCDFRFR